MIILGKQNNMTELTAHQRAMQKYNAKKNQTHAQIRITKVLRNLLKAEAHDVNLTIEEYIHHLLHIAIIYERKRNNEARNTNV